MISTTILRYPEFILAGLLGLVMLSSSATQSDWHSPDQLARVAKSFLMFAPEKYLAWMHKSFIWANWRSNFAFGDFATIKLLLPFIAFIFAAMIPLHLLCLFALVLFFIPDIFLTIFVKHRQREILDSLPQMLDLMVLCVDAGLGLDATLQKVASDATAVKKALNDELNILGRDILLGMDRERAYQELYNRCGVYELKTLGSALSQSSKLGLSIARILRAQSDFIRKRHSQQAEAKSLKMPIYMVFPLWFCIMPTLMVLVLAPSLITFFKQIHP